MTASRTGAAKSASKVTSSGPAKSKRGRGRPPISPQAIEQRRLEIVEAAYEVFAEKGYHNAGIADIAARLDIGHGTFYRYFENKRDILDHVFDFGVTRFLEIASFDDLMEVEDREQYRAKFRDLGTRMFTQVIDVEPQLPRMILLELTAIDPELLMRVLGLIDTLTAMFVPFLQLGVSRGYLNPKIDVESAARALNGCILAGLFASVRAPISVEERNRYVDTVVSLLCDNNPAQSAPARPQRSRLKAK